MIDDRNTSDHLTIPNQHTPRPHTLPNLSAIRKAFRAVGNNIIEHGTPKSLGPFVIGLTGYSDHVKHHESAPRLTTHRTGNVALGILSILTELPIVRVDVKDLPTLVSNPGQHLKFVLRTPS